ncbi:preprotein translocase subunit YajC [Nesterenkonia halotolerans]|uniref:Preprotein translocase subunit YajC n=1 Tax=Nesterenkonia halotolerans TaxID=225325 RepID=A0ABR9J3F8_9MICC|nr:preprotein translocase subunit YajC [Nesterenkonia halotolerans]MBE1513529.1 preprotein translocase subunit YajC [Nesterenkonia halotolerans]
MNALLPYAQVSASEGTGSAPGFDPLLLIMIAILVIFMVLTFRRGKKLRDEQSKARGGAVVGAQVVTAGGMVGTVVSRDEEAQRVTLEFSSGDRVDFLIGAIQQVVEPAATTED